MSFEKQAQKFEAFHRLSEFELLSLPHVPAALE